MRSNNFILPLNDPSAKSALSTGWLRESDGSKTHVVARQAIDTPQSIDIIFERLGTIAKPGWPRLWAQTTRAFSLTATLTPCLAVLALKLFNHQSINLFLGFTALLGVVALQISINIFNDVEDYRRLIDLPGSLGGSGVIQMGWFKPLELNRLAWGSLFLGMIFGLPSVLRYPQTLILISVCAVLGVLRYSAKVFGLKYWALGDLAVWILCGPALAVGFAIATSGLWGMPELCAGSFFGWLAVGILHANNIQDINIDKKRGVRTLAIVLGFKNSIRFLSLSYLIAALSLVAAGKLDGGLAAFTPPLLVLSTLALPWLLRTRNALGPDSSFLINARFKAAQIHLFSGTTLFLSLVIFWWVR